MKKKNKVQSELVSITYEEQFEMIRESLSKLSEELGYPIEIRDMNLKPPAETTSVSMRPLSPMKNKDKKDKSKE